MLTCAVTFTSSTSSTFSYNPPTSAHFFRHLRNLLPSSFRKNAVPPVRKDEPRDPLDVCLFTLPFPKSTRPPTPCHSHLRQGTTQGQSGLGLGANVNTSSHRFSLTFLQLRLTPTPSIALSPSTVRVRPHVSKPIHADYALPPIVDVPLVHGKLVRSVDFLPCFRVCMNDFAARYRSRCS